jgi:hypothetical protein
MLGFDPSTKTDYPGEQAPGFSVSWVTKSPIMMTTSQNSTPAHAMYGSPVTSTAPAAKVAGSRPAGASGPYLGRQRCIANSDTCEGPQAKGTEYCIGHLRSFQKGRDVS